jgi:hypothetical protein
MFPCILILFENKFIIFLILKKFGIISKNLIYFVLDNISNNNIILVEFSKN